jgi:adenine-specific DNA-methyltransferase
LGSFGDVDEMTDGLLVHSENWQGLNSLLGRYRRLVRCVHIDPPYNTQTSGFLYKNDYQHSSWLAMMENRTGLALSLLASGGSFLCHIDENEYERLYLLFDRFSIPNAGTIAWDKRNPMNAGRGIATQHEYVVWRSWAETPVYLRNDNVVAMLNAAADIIKKHGSVSSEVRSEYAAWIDSNADLSGGERAYRYLDDEGQIYQSVSLRAPEPRTDPKFHIHLLHPITGKPCPIPPNGFSRTPETLQDMIRRGEILFGPNEAIQPRQKVVLTKQKRRQVASVIQDARKGKADLGPMGLDFPYCHPVSLYEELLASATSNQDDIVVDHFAGSGTTGHAIINLNREDGGRRKFILVEMADYFDTVLLPRIKKVTFSPEWKDGKPKRAATAEEAERGPRIVKVIRLESYEDSLNNIVFDAAGGQQAMEFEDYLLRYMLKWEARKSETLLDIEKLASPFRYTLRIHAGGQTSEKAVDLPETFAYLLGLHVQTRRAHDDGGRRYLVYRGALDHRQVAVIWRETAGWGQADYERDRQFVAEGKLAAGADELFVNGDSFIPNARALEPLFKARMFAPVEA